MLRKLEADEALAGVGLADPFAKGKRKPLAEHLDDYAAHLTAKGDTGDHVRLTVGRVRALLDGCGFVRLADVQATAASEWLTRLREAGDVPMIPKGASFAPGAAAALLGVSREAVRTAVKRHGLAAKGNSRAKKLPRATVEALAARMSRGCSPQTVNHYVRAVRGFFRWMRRGSPRTRSTPSHC
jgi:hypothetical protein